MADMTRMARGFIVIAVALALSLAATAGAAPGGLPACQAALNTCSGSLTTTQNSLLACNGALAICTTSLNASQTDLNTCSGLLTTTQNSLLACNGALATCTTSLNACQTELAGARQYPATGQTTSYTLVNEGDDDGDVQSGATLSYTDNGDGTITDNNTGLMWEKKSNDGSIHDKDTTYTWANAFTVHIAGLNAIPGFAGHTDWRLPNIKELQSIVNYAKQNPAVSQEFHDSAACVAGCTILTCSCTYEQPNATYWSSTTSAVDTTQAWILGFANGSAFYSDKGGAGFIRAVRGGL